MGLDGINTQSINTPQSWVLYADPDNAAGDGRTVTVGSENRTVTLLAENRSVTVGPENRTVAIKTRCTA